MAPYRVYLYRLIGMGSRQVWVQQRNSRVRRPLALLTSLLRANSYDYRYWFASNR